MKASLLFFFITLCYFSYSQPIITISADKLQGCGRSVIHFDASGSSGFTSFQWDFGNGLTNTTELKPLVMFDPGKYTVTFTAYNGQSSSQKSLNVIVYKAPSGSIEFIGAPKGCTFQTISFKANGTPGDASITQYKWVYGDGEKGFGPNSSHQYQFPNGDPGYPLVLEITDANSCTYKTYTYVSISGKPKITIIPNSFYTCDSTKVNFYSHINSDVSIQSYQWNFGDGKTASMANPGLHQYVATGKYKVSLTATDINQCSNKHDTTIAIYNIKAKMEVPDSVCAGDTINFKMKPNEATHFEWILNRKDTIRVPSFRRATTGIDSLPVRLRIANNYCYSEDSILIRVSSINARFVMDTTWVCKLPYEVHFSDRTGDHVTSHEWNFGDGQTSTEKDPKHSFNKASEITLNVTSNAGCKSSATSLFSLRRPQPVILMSNAGGCLPVSVIVKADSSKAISKILSYTWIVDNGGWFSHDKQKEISYTKPIIDTIKLTIVDEVCGSETAKSIFKAGHKPIVDFQCADTFVITQYNKAINNSQPADSIDEYKWTTSNGILLTRDLNWLPYKDTAYFDTSAQTMVTEKYFPLPGDHVNITLEDGFYTCRNDKSKSIMMQGPVADIKNVYKTSCQNPTTINLNYKIYDAYKLMYEFENLKGGPGKKDSIVFPRDTTVEKIVTVTLSPGFYKVHLTAVNAKNKKRHHITYHVWKGPTVAGDHTCQKEDIVVPVSNVVKASFGINKTKACWNDIITTDPSASQNAVLHEWYAALNGGTPELIYPCYANSLTESDSLICQANPEVCATSQAYLSYFYPSCPVNSNTKIDSSKTNLMLCNRGTYDILLVSTAVNGCKDTLRKNKLIKIFKPEVTLTSNDARVCKNDEITFSLKNVIEDTTITSYKLEFGDGGQHFLSSSAELVKKSYKGGIFYPQILLQDKLGCENILPHTSLIKGRRTPDFVVTSEPHATLMMDEASCKEHNFVVTSDSMFVQYTWNFGDGFMVSNSNKVMNHSYANPGNYRVLLEVKDTIACTDTISKMLKVVSVPTFKVSVDTPYWGCPIAILGINDMAGNQYIESRTWELKNTLVHTEMPIIASPSSNIVMPIIHPGVYDISLQINSQYCGFSDSTFHKMFKMNGPYMTMMPIENNYCRTDSILFKPDSASFYNSPVFTLWNFNNKDNGKMTYSDKMITKQTFDIPGDYKVSMFYRDSLGCEMIDTSVFHIYKLKAGFSVPGPICNVPKIFTLTNTSEGYDSLIWKMGNKILKTTNFTDTITAYGKYPVSLEVYDTTGCVDSKTWILAANQKPKGMPNHKDTIICAGDTIPLKTFYDPAYHYQWYPEANLTQANDFQTGAHPTDNTLYRINIKDTTSFCESLDSIYINVQRVPQIDYGYYYLPYGTGDLYPINSDGKIRIPLGDSIRFLLSADQVNMRYQWENTDNLLSCLHCQSPDARAMKHTNIRLIPVDSLGCYGSLLQQNFELIPSDGYILMPTAFSPNGDGKNDIFKVEGPGLEKLIYLQIFTYTGSLIFETSNLNEGWDGTYHGKPQPSGVYFYKVKAKIFNDNREYEKEGALKLVK